jgi:hypothetical protein
MKDYTPIIPRDQLIKGSYYRGRCRNATEARWNGEKFIYWRKKFGFKFPEEICCPEDEQHFDVFIASEQLETPIEEIPLALE